MSIADRIKQLEEELYILRQEPIEEPISVTDVTWKDKLVQPNQEEYYIVHHNNGVPVVVKVDHNPDKPSLRKPEHAFKTDQQAELLKEKLCLLQEMFAFAHVHNDGWKPDFSGLMHGILMAGGQPTASSYTGNRNYFIFGIVLKSPEIAEKMLKEFGDRLSLYYNEQY